MSRTIAATLPGKSCYDNCLLSACLKKLFTKAEQHVKEPSLVVHNNIAAVRKDLEQLNKDGVVELSYEYLHAMERSVNGAALRYAVIYRDGAPVLFTYFQLFTLTAQNFSFEKNKGFVKGIFRFFLNLKNIKVLISGNALRNETPCCCYNKAAISSEAAAELIAATGEQIADEVGAAAVLLKDMPQSGKIGRWLQGMGYHMPWEDKVMVLSIDKKWGSMADYVAALSRKYKTRANKILNDGSELSVKSLSEREIKNNEGVMTRLFKHVADNQSFALAAPAADHFAQLKKVYGDTFEVNGFFNGAELVAFSSAFITDDAYEIYYVGFDREQNSRYQLYFNILFVGVRRSIELGKRELKLGRTSFDAKASIGARPVDLPYRIKMSIPNIVSNWFINYFSVMEDAKWKLRNPLKAAG